MSDFRGEYKTVSFFAMAHCSYCQRQYQVADHRHFFSTFVKDFLKLLSFYGDEESEYFQKIVWDQGKERRDKPSTSLNSKISV